MKKKLKALVEKITSFVTKYSFEVHFFLLAWNAFVTSWATGIAVPFNLSSIGIPFSIDLNARTEVAFVQKYMHIPTKAIAILTLLINGTIAYTAWRKSHIHTVDVPPGSVVIAQSPVDKTLESVEVKDNAVVVTKDKK